MVEGARLESVYTSKGYRGFESLSLRNLKYRTRYCSGFSSFYIDWGAKGEQFCSFKQYSNGTELFQNLILL